MTTKTKKVQRRRGRKPRYMTDEERKQARSQLLTMKEAIASVAEAERRLAELLRRGT